MDDIANLAANDRRVLFERTAAQMPIPAAITEKDFWVCWTLKRLFEMPALGDHLTFKGGTALSKVYGAIHRFSEDIDLTIDRSAFGYGGEKDPAEASSNKRRETMMAEMARACVGYVHGDIRRSLTGACADALTKVTEEWRVDVDQRDPDQQTLLFAYPSAVAVDSSTAYIEPAVRLEFGSRGGSWPTARVSIRPYACQAFPSVCSAPDAEVTALTAERTFWEKVTILHQEANRPADKPAPDRYSRHYYDLAMLAVSPVRRSALAQVSLLDSVVQHKRHFFRCGWAGYESARRGTLRLSPPEERLGPLRADYRHMQMMIFGEPPEFEQVMTAIADLEEELNDL